MISTKAATVAAGGVAAAGGLNAITVPLFNVPLVTIGMAAFGALLSFSYGRAVAKRLDLYKMAFANTFLGCALVTVLPAALNWEWMQASQLQPSLAFMLAMGARWFVPLAIEIAPAATRGALSRFFGIKVDPPSNPSAGDVP